MTFDTQNDDKWWQNDQKDDKRCQNTQNDDKQRQVMTSDDIDIEWQNQLTRIAESIMAGVEGRELTSYLTAIGMSLHTYCTEEALTRDVKLAEKRAYKRIYGMRRSLTDQIKDFVMNTTGMFTTRDVHEAIMARTRNEKMKVNKILQRLKKKELIEPCSSKTGCYRLIKKSESVDWTKAQTDPVKLWLPFELSSPSQSVITPGDIVLYMGVQNAGKSAVMMNVAKENREWYNCHYFSSEMRAGNFKRRMAKFGLPVENMQNINFYHPVTDYVANIVPGKGNLNIIDYIELHDNFYQIAGILDGIFNKLDGAVCIAAMQKDPNAEFGRGGSFTQDKPVLSVAIERGNIARITKCKEWPEGVDNPNGKQYKFKLVDGCKFMRDGRFGWMRPVNNKQSKSGGNSYGI